MELLQLDWFQPVQGSADRGIGGDHLAGAAEGLFELLASTHPV